MNAIEIKGIGKSFRIGETAQGDADLTTAVLDALVGPFRRIRSLMRNQLPDFAEKEFWALKDITFDVQEGEVMGIIGRNGAGKSTLLKILTGISAPTVGRATIRGRVGSLLEVGTGFHPELTGRENVFMNGTILGMKQGEIRAKFDQIVDFSGVNEFIDTPVKRYSSGMQMRLAFSVAAFLEPEVLLVDEVLSVGDAEFRRKCLGVMRDVTGKGRTVMLVSHSMASIQNMCNRVVLLDAGRIAMIDNADRVVSEYLRRTHGSAAQAVADLTNHPNRKPFGEPTLTQLRILNAAGEPTPVIPAGESLVIELSLDAQERIYTNCFATLTITNDREQRIAKLNTKFQLDENLTVTGKQVFTCTWDDCILSPGEYIIDVSLRSSTHANDHGGQTIDQVAQALTFEIAPSDIFKTGRIPDEGMALLWPRSRWDLSHVDETASEAVR